MYKQGAVILVPFPFTDLSGHKVRPCLVLYAQKHGEDCIVAFLSSVEHKKIGAFDLRIKATKQNGLKKDSVLKLDKLATLQKKIILGEIGVLEPGLVKIVNTRLKKLFQLL